MTPTTKEPKIFNPTTQISKIHTHRQTSRTSKSQVQKTKWSDSSNRTFFANERIERKVYLRYLWSTFFYKAEFQTEADRCRRKRAVAEAGRTVYSDRKIGRRKSTRETEDMGTLLIFKFLNIQKLVCLYVFDMQLSTRLEIING